MEMSALALPPACPERSEGLPLPFACAQMNSTDCTNMPEEPQQGSYTRPRYGSSISTRSLTTQRGV